jgi:hypothetical protein
MQTYIHTHKHATLTHVSTPEMLPFGFEALCAEEVPQDTYTPEMRAEIRTIDILT